MKSEIKRSNKVIYLDHAATTYLNPVVKQAMEPFWEAKYGNPSSLYSLGREAAEVLKTSREKVATFLNTKPQQIIFTAGGTESINLAIFGVVNNFDPTIKKWHVITTTIEHSAVLNSCASLKDKGYDISYLEVDQKGFINLNDLIKTIRPETILISVMYANNEIGTIEPIKEIAKQLKKINNDRLAQNLPQIIFHSDACQAGGFLDINTETLGIDLLTINGSKMYGPKQTGILYFREGIKLKPYIFGGGQERNLRSGTENIPGIVGFTKALELAQSHCQKENNKLSELRNYFINRILHEIPDSILNGPSKNLENKAIKRLPNNINISFKQVDGEALLLYLDKNGICVSTGSACTAKSAKTSHVLEAINCPDDYINGSIRFTLGKKNTKDEIDYVTDILKNGIKQLRQVSAVTHNLKKIRGTAGGSSCTEMK